MNELADAIVLAVGLIFSADGELASIVLRSLTISLSATVIASLIGLPIGAALAVTSFRGRRTIVVLLNGLMGLPPVVVGLLVYTALSRAGPLGPLGLIFTPTAMIIAQSILITPIVAALTLRLVRSLHEEYDEQLRSFGAGRLRVMATLLWDGRAGLATAVLAGFGRAMAEVGAVIVVGGNIAHLTRVMTTTIALETSKGNLALALALGLILVILSLLINAIVLSVSDRPATGRA